MRTPLKLPTLLTTFVLGMTSATFAWSAETENPEMPIGYVKNTEGEAFVTHLGHAQKAETGLSVHIGSVHRARAPGRCPAASWL